MINHSWKVAAAGKAYVLQRINPAQMGRTYSTHTPNHHLLQRGSSDGAGCITF